MTTEATWTDAELWTAERCDRMRAHLGPLDSRVIGNATPRGVAVSFTMEVPHEGTRLHWWSFYDCRSWPPQPGSSHSSLPSLAKAYGFTRINGLPWVVAE